MIKIVGYLETPRATLELDTHIPFLVRLGEHPPRGNSLIWYCKPDVRPMFEVWLDGLTGALHRISIVVIDPSRIVETRESDAGPRVPTAGRIPIGDIAPWRDSKVAWESRQRDEADPFRLVIGADFASVEFTSAGAPREWIVNHRSRFGVNSKGYLCRFDITGLTASDVASIRDAAKMA